MKYQTRWKNRLKYGIIPFLAGTSFAVITSYFFSAKMGSLNNYDWVILELRILSYSNSTSSQRYLLSQIKRS